MTRLIPLQDVLQVGTECAILITNNQSINIEKDCILAQSESEEKRYRIDSEVVNQPLKKGFRMFILSEIF